MAGFTKLYSDIITSSIWSEDDHTRILWVTMLALAESDGFVPGSVTGLAVVARMDVEDCRRSIAKLEAPDADSRTTDYDGRRIEKCHRGWMILNYTTFRNRRDYSDNPDAIRKRIARGNQPDKPGHVRTNTGPSASASVSASVPESEGEDTSDAKSYDIPPATQPTTTSQPEDVGPSVDDPARVCSNAPFTRAEYDKAGRLEGATAEQLNELWDYLDSQRWRWPSGAAVGFDPRSTIRRGIAASERMKSKTNALIKSATNASGKRELWKIEKEIESAKAEAKRIYSRLRSKYGGAGTHEEIAARMKRCTPAAELEQLTALKSTITRLDTEKRSVLV